MFSDALRQKHRTTERQNGIQTEREKDRMINRQNDRKTESTYNKVTMVKMNDIINGDLKMNCKK